MHLVTHRQEVQLHHEVDLSGGGGRGGEVCVHLEGGGEGAQGGVEEVGEEYGVGISLGLWAGLHLGVG